MFNEHARRHGREGADLIVVPRAAGLTHDDWIAAGAIAAIVSGCFVVSSNGVGRAEGGATFGGKGFAFAPDGALLSPTSAEYPIAVVDIDVDAARRLKLEYPCYVVEN
jgi:N-carbamoylputrescine amidase